MIKIGMLIGDRYEILEKIGTGGMSDVYKAKCHKLNRYVAVKVLKQEFSENANFVSKFRVEAQAAAGLMHPNIVNVYDVGEEDGIYYIVMELVEGPTLKNYIEKKARLSVKEAISIAIQISMGIEAAHNNHIIHRDIKPQNIIISKDGKVKVMDFGIAKAATSNTITSNVMGSVHYTSPEQARGGFSDEKSDIYSLGITLFEMLTGRVPFNGETTVAIAIKHIQDEIPSPREFVPEIPISIEQIVFKCTQKSPDRRYQTTDELILDLKKSLMNPDENFVKVVDFASQEETRMISAGDMVQIKKQSVNRDSYDDHAVYSQEMKKKPKPKQNTTANSKNNTTRKPMEQEQAAPKRKSRPVAVEEDPEDEEYDPKMEKVTTILMIVVAVIIGCIILFVAGRTFGLFGANDKKKVEIEIQPTEETTKQPEKTPEVDKKGVSVPIVVGLSEAEATAKIEAASFKVVKEEVYSDTVKKGLVVSQNPKEGTKVSRESTITVEISKGTEENKVKVPSVLGMTEASAKDTLQAAGLKCSAVSEVVNEEYPVGMVCYQSYSVGSKVDKGTDVEIRISIGSSEETYSCNINVNAPIDYQSGNATVIAVADNGVQLYNGTHTSFPVPINVSGIKGAQAGKVTITYTVSAEEQVTDENGNVTTQTKQVQQTQEQVVNFTKE